MNLLLLVIIILIVYYIFIYKEAYKNMFDQNNKKKCPNCGNPIESNFNVCPICKETLKIKCTECGSMVDINWRYCPYCKSDRKGDSR
jgi:RNA polymerase subunit RPABC4/transcription elongation factor Spt4